MLLLSVGLTCGVIFSNDGTLTSGTQDQRAGELRRIDGVDQAASTAMIDAYSVPCAPDDDREHRARPGAVQHRDRNVVAGV